MPKIDIGVEYSDAEDYDKQAREPMPAGEYTLKCTTVRQQISKKGRKMLRAEFEVFDTINDVTNFGAISLTQIPGDPDSIKGNKARGVFWTKPDSTGKEVSRDVTVEEEKKSTSWLNIALVMIIIGVLFIGAYFLFFKKPELVEIVVPGQSQLEGWQQLGSLSFDPQELLTSPKFKLLRQFETPAPTLKSGRPNPFIPY